MNYCSVCDRELPDDARDCRYCGAPSTAVMSGLHQGDQWERLADDGSGPLLRDELDGDEPRPAGRASDPRLDALAGAGDEPDGADADGAAGLVGAGLSYRLPAKLIDIALRLAIVWLTDRTLGFDPGAWYVDPTMSERLRGGLAMVVVLFALVLYPIVFEATLGRTPGKVAVGCRVLTTEGRSCGWRGATIRNLTLEVIGMWFLVIGGLFFIWSLAGDPRHRHAADRLAGTVVVKVEKWA